jgi:hypothetical protein
MKLFSELEKSGDLFPYFDYAHGFGVPQADYFYDKGKSNTNAINRVDLTKGEKGIKVLLVDTTEYRAKEINSISIAEPGLLYIKISDEQGKILHYRVVDPVKIVKVSSLDNPLFIRFNRYPMASSVSVFYHNEYETINTK